MKKFIGIIAMMLTVALSVGVFASCGGDKKPSSGGVTVSYVLNYEGGTAPASKQVKPGEKYGELPAPTREHYVFNGWSSSNTTFMKVTADTIVTAKVDHSLFANWSGEKYTVTYDLNYDGAPAGATKTVEYGGIYGKQETPSRQGLIFGGWNTKQDGSGVNVNPTDKVTATGDHSLYAQWMEEKESIDFTDPEDLDRFVVKNDLGVLCTKEIVDRNGGKAMKITAPDTNSSINITLSGVNYGINDRFLFKLDYDKAAYNDESNWNNLHESYLWICMGSSAVNSTSEMNLYNKPVSGAWDEPREFGATIWKDNVTSMTISVRMDGLASGKIAGIPIYISDIRRLEPADVYDFTSETDIDLQSFPEFGLNSVYTDDHDGQKSATCSFDADKQAVKLQSNGTKVACMYLKFRRFIPAGSTVEYKVSMDFPKGMMKPVGFFMEASLTGQNYGENPIFGDTSNGKLWGVDNAGLKVEPVNDAWPTGTVTLSTTTTKDWNYLLLLVMVESDPAQTWSREGVTLYIHEIRITAPSPEVQA